MTRRDCGIAVLVDSQRPVLRAGLDRRDDVLLASYQDMLATPVAAMQAICSVPGPRYRPALIAHISPRGPRRPGHSTSIRACAHSATSSRPPRRDPSQPARWRCSLEAWRERGDGARRTGRQSDRAIFRQSGLTGVAAMAGVIAGLILDISIACGSVRERTPTSSSSLLAFPSVSLQ